MRIKVLSVQRKELTIKNGPKAGQQLNLRVVNACDTEGRVFTFNLPRDHDDVPPGEATAVAEPWINFDTELAGRVRIVPTPAATGNAQRGA